MKITIKISQRLAEHLQSPHTFEDSCGPADDVLRLVQKQIDKKLRKKRKKKEFLSRYKIKQEPVKVNFKTHDGRKFSFWATRAVKLPERVNFQVRRKLRLKHGKSR